MDLELSDEQQELQRAVRAVLERECPVSLVRHVVEKGADASALWNRMVELDWPALAVPAGDGGLGLGTMELAVVAEELGRALAPVPFQATAAQFVTAVSLVGSAEQRQRFLGPVVTRGMVATLAVAGEAGRWTPDAVAVTAHPDGGEFVLGGTAAWVFDGVLAEELVVAARLPGTAGEEGLGLFVVPAAAVRAEAMSVLDPTRSLARVAFDGARVDAARVLAAPGAGAAPLRAVLQVATAVLSAEIVGTCQAIFDVVHAYVGEREQFGVKIGSFQAIKHKLANMFVALESARATAYYAAAAVDEDAEDAPLAVSTAKAAAGDCQKLLGQEGIQTLGGIGYTWEHDMHLYVKRAKAASALLGTAAEHRAAIATAIGL